MGLGYRLWFEKKWRTSERVVGGGYKELWIGLLPEGVRD